MYPCYQEAFGIKKRVLAFPSSGFASEGQGVGVPSVQFIRNGAGMGLESLR
jgi:hypothetical protein